MAPLVLSSSNAPSAGPFVAEQAKGKAGPTGPEPPDPTRIGKSPIEGQQTEKYDHPERGTDLDRADPVGIDGFDMGHHVAPIADVVLGLAFVMWHVQTVTHSRWMDKQSYSRCDFVTRWMDKQSYSRCDFVASGIVSKGNDFYSCDY